MRTAYIVKGYRTAVGKAPKGLFRFKRPDELAAETIEHMMKELPNFDKTRIDDVMVGNAMPEAEQGLNVGRLISLMGLKVEDVPVEVEKVNETIFEAVTPVEEVKEEIQPEPVVAETPKVLEEEVKATFEKVSQEPKISSLNDRLNKTISFGLNDRIGFEKKLFGGSSDDFNRVISQLNTFDSFEEAKSFVLDFVKPDYNNWEGNEEFEARFMEIVEKKFS